RPSTTRRKARSANLAASPNRSNRRGLRCVHGSESVRGRRNAMRRIAVWGVLTAGIVGATQAGAATSKAAQAKARHYAVLSNGDRIGKLDVVTTGKIVEIDWRVDENGRGPKMKEHVELGPGGVPVAWQIEGVGAIGAPVKESF